jgi:hypothetical protein
MSRLLCSLMLTLSVALVAFGPTASFANSSNPKFPVNSTQGGSGNTCQSGGSGCTDVKSNPAGKNCTCTTNVDNKCATAC